jgi:hypothetical protein
MSVLQYVFKTTWGRGGRLDHTVGCSLILTYCKVETPIHDSRRGGPHPGVHVGYGLVTGGKPLTGTAQGGLKTGRLTGCQKLSLPGSCRKGSQRRSNKHYLTGGKFQRSDAGLG